MSPFLSPPHTDMPTTADVVIIGGGPAGTAALWAIEQAAPGTKTVLIEQGAQLGSGASTASLENFRTCWMAPCLARLMTRSIEVFLDADAYLGAGASQEINARQHGYLWVGFTDSYAATLRAEVDQLHAAGLPHMEYLDADEIRHRFPWLGDRVLAAKYDPTAGWLDSNALIYRYARSVPGAVILLEVADVQITLSGGRVTGVTTPSGAISAPNVVIAAGANSRGVGRTAGVELPLVLRPRQSFTTGWRHDAYPADGPCVIGAPPFPHLRPEAGSGAIFGWEYGWNDRHLSKGPAADSLVDPLWPVSRWKDPRFPSLVLALLARQFGHAPGTGFADSRYLRGLTHNAGYYVYRGPEVAYKVDSTGARRPYVSQRALIDAVPGLEGLFVSSAHVGHGIMSSAAAGEILASRVLRRDLPEPVFAGFDWDAPWVPYDSGGLSAE